MLVQPPCLSAVVVNRCPPHISSIFPKEGTAHCTMHCACIVPNNEVAWILPLYLDGVLGLCRVLVQLIKKYLCLLRLITLEVMDMGSHVKVHSARGLVTLYKPVAAHGVFEGINVGEEFGCRELARMVHGVIGNIILIQKLCF